MRIEDINPIESDLTSIKTKNPNKKIVHRVKVGESNFYLNRNGWYRERLSGNHERICGPFEYIEHRSNLGSDQVQVAVKFRDVNKEVKIIVVNRSDISNGNPLMSRLIDCGLEVNDRKLAAQLVSQVYQKYPPDKTVLTTRHPGWHTIQPDGIDVYVTNQGTIKPKECKANIVLEDGIAAGFDSSGVLEDWNANVGAVCVGNSRLQFGICVAIASTLLHFSGLPNFGALIEGPSKLGKTVTLLVAASVMGGDSYLLSWNSTANALEIIAVCRCDGLIPLDEIGQGDAKAVSEAVYDLMNGRTKSRLGSDIKLDSGIRFRGLVLASGELDLRTLLKQGGIAVKEGQLVRLFSVPVPLHGVFSRKHGHITKDSFVASLVQSMAKYHGTLGPAFIAHIVESQAQLKAELPEMVREIAAELLQRLSSIPDQGTYGHVAKCFALVAIAGELAISAHLLKWDKGSARAAVEKCFLAWAKHEKLIASMSDQGVFRQLQRFFQSERSGKFAPFSEFECTNGKNLAGYLHKVDGVNVYLVYRAYFETKLCSKFGKATGIRALRERNLVILGGRSTPTRQVNIPKSLQRDGNTKMSFYVIREAILRA